MKFLPSVLLSFAVAGVGSAKNMNGEPGQYKIANGDDSQHSIPFQTDYTAEYFEVYSGIIQTRYSEVFWTGMPLVHLPEDIVERFANKTMAVVGYEVDQVKVDKDGNEVPVPITHAYNHHYCSWLLNSKKARLVQTKASLEILRLGITHGSQYHWVTEFFSKEDEKSTEPLVQFFSEGNGGEMRLSYHGYPKGYAQLIYGPDKFRIDPMQIDTWNRDEPSPKFKPGPLPKSSRIPPTAGFSGLLECPCSDRIQRAWNMTYQPLLPTNNKEGCETPVQSEHECWSAVEQLIKASIFRHHVEQATDKPRGCSFVQHQDGATDVYWNPKESFTVSNQQDDTIEKDKIAFAAGQVNVTVAIEKEDADDAVVLRIVGPPDRWFGIGFGSSSMCLHPTGDQCPDGGPYTILVQGDHVEERKLGNHAGGSVLMPSPGFKVHFNQIVSGNRAVVITRAKQGPEFSFNMDTATVPIIMARGCGMEFAQHCGHNSGQLQFLNQETVTQICQAGVDGSIQGRAFNQQHRCTDYPRGELKRQHNPTCEVETYRGGLFCCNHGQSLLDKNQPIPWEDQYLEYQLKFRFYFEEYQTRKESSAENAQSMVPSHQNLVRLLWAIDGHAGEYDIPPCKNSDASSQCVHTISSRFHVRDMMADCGTHTDASSCTGEGSSDPQQTQGIQLIYASAHCHAPSCLSVELYIAKTGQLLCRVEPIYGESTDKVYDEKGYLALPPCLWGDAAEGLAPPVLLSLDTELFTIKRCNNTLPHTGEMALWQMRGVVVPRESTTTRT